MTKIAPVDEDFIKICEESADQLYPKYKAIAYKALEMVKIFPFHVTRKEFDEYLSNPSEEIRQKIFKNHGMEE